MRYHVLATDYDGTIAHHGRVDDATLAALDELRRSGRKLVLVTGRVLEDLATVFSRSDVFDYVVAENGAVLHRPASQETRALAEPPPPRFIEMLRAHDVAPLHVGHVIVATWHPQEDLVLEVIRSCGLELHVVFNKGAVMVLPSGVNKATGLAAALAELKLSPHDAIGVGDAENDHAFLATCECGVAVANALPALKERAHFVTAGDHGRGVQELARALLDDRLGDLATCAERTALTLGTRPDGAPLALPAHGPPSLIVGASGSGKSTLATRLLEELAERAYQFCVIDPEGDYLELDQATVLGDADHPASVDQALELLEVPAQSCVLNLLGIPLAERPAFVDALLPRFQELRARTGRPHWIIADEAHHLFPPEWQPGALTLPDEIANLLLITVHPERVSPALLGRVAVAFAVGADAEAMIARLTATLGEPAPRAAAPLEPGQALAWLRSRTGELVAFVPTPPRGERRRHVRKYAAGELGEDKSFYFRGPGERLKLRARNLQAFVDLADGVDDDTWRHHLARADYSRWFRDAIKDEDLAAEAERVEQDRALAPADSRAAIRAAIERRYTAPA
jgi:hydroxymethylpyrimidine pyrophosphatase-like HAD family hydrolase